LIPKAVLLAAGRGERLKPLTEEIPKVMVPINGKPILEYHIEQLVREGIREIFINLHYLPEVIKAYFLDGSRWGVDIRYSYEPEILGTAGAIKQLEKELSGGPFLVIYGDNFLEVDYFDFVRFSERHKALATIAVFEKEDVQGSGILDINERYEILRFLEKPKPEEVFSHWVNAGVFYFQKEIMAFIGEKQTDFGFEIFPKLLQAKEKLIAYKLKKRVWAIDNMELLKELQENINRSAMGGKP
jgi:NDP-sugar pyrophosphorylase family protein